MVTGGPRLMSFMVKKKVPIKLLFLISFFFKAFVRWCEAEKKK